MNFKLFNKLPNELLKKIAVLADIQREKDIGAYLVGKLHAASMGNSQYALVYFRQHDSPVTFTVVYESETQSVVPVLSSSGPSASLLEDQQQVYDDFSEYVFVLGGSSAVTKLGLKAPLKLPRKNFSFRNKSGHVWLKVKAKFKFYDAAMHCGSRWKLYTMPDQWFM
jgi:hypothetical protein